MGSKVQGSNYQKTSLSLVQEIRLIVISNLRNCSNNVNGHLSNRRDAKQMCCCCLLIFFSDLVVLCGNWIIVNLGR